jgi:predicted negative regulator of RcsB-dependent stress response
MMDAASKYVPHKDVYAAKKARQQAIAAYVKAQESQHSAGVH